MRESVYGFTFSGPDEIMSRVNEPLERVDAVFSLDIGRILFPSWTCLRTFPLLEGKGAALRLRIGFTALWPLVLVLLGALAHSFNALLKQMLLALCCKKATPCRSLGLAIRSSLGAFVFVTFCMLPSVTRSLFLAFECEEFGFDDGRGKKRSFLMASFDVECDFEADAYQNTIATSAVFIVAWPISMPLLYAFLLWRSRRSIRSHMPNALSRSIRFLWSEYQDTYYYW